MPGAIFGTRTIGHSARSLEDLVAILKAHGIAYQPEPRLGGMRRAHADSANAAWRNAGFRGYADHMGTAEFQQGLDRLIEAGRRERVAIMCAAAVPRLLQITPLPSQPGGGRSDSARTAGGAYYERGDVVTAYSDTLRRVKEGCVIYTKESLDFD
ncbi:MAG: DUF488 domain-containing protein [Bryobacteraceae bacterium]